MRRAYQLKGRRGRKRTRVDMRSGGWWRHVTRWSPATGHPMPTAGRLGVFISSRRFAGPAASLGFVGAAACFRARFIGGGDETKSGSMRGGLGRFLSSIFPASSSCSGCCGRRRETALPMRRWEALRAGEEALRI